MAELGSTLSRVRRARDISLEDAERDTHVSRRYLMALETEDFSVFPAPVYARGFLRTYARYLGINPDELMQSFPSPESEQSSELIAPLPTVSRPPAPMVNINWVVAAVVGIFILGAGLLLLQGSGNGSVSGSDNGQNTILSSSPSQVIGADAQTSSFDNGAPAQGRQIGPIRPGEIPELVGSDLASSLAYLRDNDIPYVVVEFPNATTPRGIVIDQSPDSGSDQDDDTRVTLYVSGGEPQ